MEIKKIIIQKSNVNNTLTLKKREMINYKKKNAQQQTTSEKFLMIYFASIFFAFHVACYLGSWMVF